jgi:hypothetical protein
MQQLGLIELVEKRIRCDATHVTVKLLNLVPLFQRSTKKKFLESVTIIVEDNGLRDGSRYHH